MIQAAWFDACMTGCMVRCLHDRLNEAEDHYRMALAAVRKQLGPDDPEQVAYVANLAGVLQEKEQHQEAEKLLESALQLCKRTLGPQHPMTATVMNNLGEALARQKRIEEAEPLVRLALKVRVGMRASATVRGVRVGATVRARVRARADVTVWVVKKLGSRRGRGRGRYNTHVGCMWIGEDARAVVEVHLKTLIEEVCLRKVVFSGMPDQCCTSVWVGAPRLHTMWGHGMMVEKYMQWEYV
eukprot:1161992-Pelagomonas_calceolata.AAC.6